MIFPQPRPEIRDLSPVAHGALDFAELEQSNLRPDDILDFSVNSNPYGSSHTVRTAIASVPLDRYPDREALALRRALSAHHIIPMESILPGNGTVELIWLVALAYLQPGDFALILGPTFGEYANAAALMGAEIHSWHAQPEDNFAFNPIQIAHQLEWTNYRLVFLCNPNNPTGQSLPIDRLTGWAAQYPDTLFVVDEAYITFAADAASALSLNTPNVLVLRSMTKDYALAGLRLGYAVGSLGVIAALRKVRPPWNVNALAQAAGIAALADQAHLHASLQKLRENKRAFVAGLIELGLSPIPSSTHYFLVRVGDGAGFRRTLLWKGLQVRDCASFGLPAYMRIATRRPEENARLLVAIREVKS